MQITLMILTQVPIPTMTLERDPYVAQKKKKKKKKDLLVTFFSYLSQKTGPSCSKLTMALVNDSLKFTSSDMQIG